MHILSLLVLRYSRLARTRGALEACGGSCRDRFPVARTDQSRYMQIGHCFNEQDSEIAARAPAAVERLDGSLRTLGLAALV